ncbi:MAG: InlB B-repeat-containing protein, partial [Bacteroidales bacterium]|nr:InlB B-repeat-containing protein [Bacteroidales bacterium]
MNQKLRETMARLLSLRRRAATWLLLACMSSTTAWAQTQYLAYNAGKGYLESQTANNVQTLTSSTTLGTAGQETWYALKSNVTVNDHITTKGTVHLILCDGYTFTAKRGIEVNEGNTLVIYGQIAGTGTLNSTGVSLFSGGECSAIGTTGGNGAVGTIIIHGGNIIANGAGWSAGIGGGIRSGGGTFAMYGGTVCAYGHDGGSEAIGHGQYGGNMTSRTIADGLCVKVGSNTTPETAGNRVSSLSNKSVKIEPCTDHIFSNGKCTYCGVDANHVFYHRNNATAGYTPTDNQSYASGSIVTVAGNIGGLTLTGYKFANWNTKADGSGTDYAEGATFTFVDVTTLYAQWTEDPSQWSDITVANTEHGTVTCVDRAIHGSKVTINVVSTDEGYHVSTVKYNDGTDHVITPVKGVYSFTMPSKPVTITVVYADINMPYLSYNGETGMIETLNPPSYTDVNSTTTTMGENGKETWYVVNGNVTVNGQIKTAGTVHLILCDGSTLNANGIRYGNLHIHPQSQGTGKINSSITGHYGTLAIHGGVITSNGGDWGAGIGGGGANEGGGSISIYGGNITANSGPHNHGGDHVAIGAGSSGPNVQRYFADGMCVKVNGTVQLSGNRANNATSVQVMPCTSHSYTNGRCKYCGHKESGKYDVTYSDNFATSGAVPSDNTQYPYGSTVTVLDNTGNLHRTGYLFDVWNMAQNGKGTNYAAGSTFKIGKDVTLYSTWKENPAEWSDVSIADGIEHGSITCTPSHVMHGEKVTLTVTPGNGYLINTVTYSYGGNEYEISPVDDVYSFAMPAADVVVNATFRTLSEDADGNFIISNTKEWDALAARVAGGETFSGKTV